MKLLRFAAWLVSLRIVFAPIAFGQVTTVPTSPLATTSGRELAVVTKNAAPFAMEAPDGSGHGVSIDLWRRVAEQMHLRYRLVEVRTVQDLLGATSAGSADAAVSAITVTADRT